MILLSLHKTTDIQTWQSNLFLLFIQKCLQQFVSLASAAERWEFVFICLASTPLRMKNETINK